MKSGGGSANADGVITTKAIAVIASVAIAAMAASDTQKRVRRRTDEAFTTLTLLRSQPSRSKLRVLVSHADHHRR